MSQARLNISVRPTLKTRRYPARVNQPVRVPRHELEVKLADLQQNYAELHTEIFEAAQVHRRLCAPRYVRFGEFEVASEIFAVRHLPGDFFTVAEKSDGVVLALGDICGKGLAAGMWTTHLVGLVGARVEVSSKPQEVVAGVNRDLCLMKSFMPLASLFLARLDQATGEVQYCSAGHPPALLVRSDGKLELLSDGGMLLGVVPGAPYVCGTVKLGAGDVLMVYSDGITESQDTSGEEFGSVRLESQLRRAIGQAAEPNSAVARALATRADASSILFSVLGAVQDFASASPIVDDMTVAVLRRDT